MASGLRKKYFQKLFSAFICPPVVGVCFSSLRTAMAKEASPAYGGTMVKAGLEKAVPFVPDSALMIIMADVQIFGVRLGLENLSF